MKLISNAYSGRYINETNMMTAILQLQPIQRMAHKRNLLTQWLLRLRQYFVQP